MIARELSDRQLVSMIEKLEFLIGLARESGTKHDEMERGLENYRAELQRREALRAS